jgi:tetratricopeptide (TPR) repeat protein
MNFCKTRQAVTDTFPIIFNYRGLIEEDFSRFSQSYAEILKRRLPTAQKVCFFNVAGQLIGRSGDMHLPADWTQLMEAVGKGERSSTRNAQSLLLLFAVKDGGSVVAVVEGTDPVFLAKVGEDWLEETRAAAEREFILLKEARIDVQSGLFNLWNLSSLLESSRQPKGLRLVLIELPPKRISFRYAVRYSQKCATLILNFLQGESVLHSIGQSTFALVLPCRNGETKSEVESALVAYLKREGCHKVHIGSSSSQDKAGEIGAQLKERNLLDEAWTALHHAEKRGPFSFCDYNLLAHPENHPFAAPHGNLLRRLSRMWRHSQAFSLVHFRSAGIAGCAAQVVQPYIDHGISLTTGMDILVYLEGVEVGAALSWAQEVVNRAFVCHPNNPVSAGVSCFPCDDFKKTELLVNCRKALRHASFFGEPSAVVFDSVSLNISGDVYFGDGDLAKAVQEYRKGLRFDKKNVNLHNSLGVALAMMDKLGQAMQSFENALAIDSRNFMALYNLGLAEQARGRKEEAYQYLEKAFAHYNEEDAGLGLLDDLKLQLGILAGDLGKNRRALDYLEAWQKHNDRKPRAGRVLYHIGMACHGAGDNRRAMVELQRALQFNEFDDRAMDLLGTVYLEEGEGDEIALALCRKSAELEPGNIVYRCNLAEVQVQCGMLALARENLYRCLKSKKTRTKAQVLLGRSYAREGNTIKATSWFAKALRQGDLSKVLYEEASAGVKGCNQTISAC